MPELARWDSFYVIVGSAAGALIGLQFVVLTLIAERPPPRAADAGAAFATPTIVHFGAAFFLSALLRVPWQTIIPAAVAWGLAGLCGVAYAMIVARRMRTQAAYRPVFEDWLFHVVLPSAAYATLALSSFSAPAREREALFGVGAAALLLLFIGILNAWDAVAYHVLVNRGDSRSERRRDEPPEKTGADARICDGATRPDIELAFLKGRPLSDRGARPAAASAAALMGRIEFRPQENS